MLDEAGVTVTVGVAWVTAMLAVPLAALYADELPVSGL
jgi:hypothetical protein